MTKMRGGIAVLLLMCLAFACSARAEGAFTPSGGACDHENCYWTTPMDITDEAAVWAMLMSPVTVLDGHQKSQVLLYAEPDKASAVLAEVTCASQSVHVLSHTDTGWTRVETYSSSFANGRTTAWNAFVAGYVETALLKVVTPDPAMGLVVDKLTQRLYVFVDGKLFSTLRVSTGLANDEQPYNETRSGEFFLVSKVGGFADGRMVCEKALRFNDGDLIHQVPYYLGGNGSKDFTNYESKLGQRASHGCIRVQRKRTPEGVNMTWLWDRYKLNTKLVVWEDIAGREMPAVPDDTAVYYNPKGGKDYHRAETCYGVREEYLPMTPLTFAELLGAHDELTPCVWCNPPERN